MSTGLFFGSFNPVHIGHMALVNYMLEFTSMKKIWMVVSPHNPLKKKSSLLADHHRLEMVRLAIGDHPKIKASNVEFGLPQPSYTVNTLAYLQEQFPKEKFSLIMGMDNLETFHKWKNFEYILEHHEIFVYPRHGHTGGIHASHPNVTITEAPELMLSSTFIRNSIRSKKDMRFFVPEAVWKYIDEMNLYRK